MNRILTLIIVSFLAVTGMLAENATPVQDTTAVDSAALKAPVIPLWKQKLYYGYNFDIYYHHDSQEGKKENGWSIRVIPELGWRVSERFYMGMRFGGSYADTYATYSVVGDNGVASTETLRVQTGTWEVVPYGRYRLKTMFDGKVGIWIETHLYAGMEFPHLRDNSGKGTDYYDLKHSITYGAQVSPVVTYQFNKRTAVQLFFSIMSLGYSGTTRCYSDHKEYTNDVIIFSGKFSNLIANQFTPGLYGIKFGVIKNFK